MNNPYDIIGPISWWMDYEENPKYITIKRKKMYHKINAPTTVIKVNESYEGETIEKKIRRIVSNKEPITDGATIIHTDRRDGVQPGYDIRTDRWEVAVEAMDKVSKTHKAKREERHKVKENTTKVGDENTGKEAIKGMENEGGA